MTRKTYTVKVTEDCEELLTAMPRGFELELVSEEYADNENIIVFEADESAAIERALDAHRGVVSYGVKDAN